MDEKESLKSNMGYLDYLSYFINPKMAKSLEEKKEEREKHAFKSDEEFVESLKNRDFKNNKYIEAIRKINKG